MPCQATWKPEAAKTNQEYWSCCFLKFWYFVYHDFLHRFLCFQILHNSVIYLDYWGLWWPFKSNLNVPRTGQGLKQCCQTQLNSFESSWENIQTSTSAHTLLSHLPHGKFHGSSIVFFLLPPAPPQLRLLREVKLHFNQMHFPCNQFLTSSLSSRSQTPACNYPLFSALPSKPSLRSLSPAGNFQLFCELKPIPTPTQQPLISTSLFTILFL